MNRKPEREYRFEKTETVWPSKNLESVETGIQQGSLVEKIRKFLRLNKIHKAMMWKTPEFMDFYFSEKTKIAKTLCKFLKNYEKPYRHKVSTPEKYLKIGENYLSKAYRTIRAEELKLEKILKNSRHLPREKRNQKIIQSLGVEDTFDETNPYFFHSKNVLVAVLNEKDYVQAQDDSSAGVFWDEEVPLVLMKANAKFGEFDLSEIYYGMLLDVTEEIAFSKASISIQDQQKILKKLSPQHQEFFKGTKKCLDQKEQEDYITAIFEELADLFPFEEWFASIFLEITPVQNSIFKGKRLKQEELKENEDFQELHAQAKETIRHEFHHSTCRFLPVHKIQHKQENLNSQEVLDNWLSRVAEEIVIYSYAREFIDTEYYRGLYNSEETDLNDAEKEQINAAYSELAAFLQEINQRLVHSENPKLLSVLFSLEPVTQWKSLHQYLMGGGLPELGYFIAKDLPQNNE